MSNRVTYTTLSIYPAIADRIDTVKTNLGLGNKSQTIEVLLTAYDILNNTGYGGRFSEAVKTVIKEDKSS